ncbi:hypothetical protein [Enterococcus pallens]|uniref:Uncharacterized protein n=1 Tax=Enterococcus pallens ATCC BAA-351 TaxID=1158607 RepID=R2SQ31_9ENTE|nr:hypothetical protein [Enterococcus pallens]EOH90254.1 hypothetical protein UAU_04083 [Enterococcus pallens ATCC BAA-351]EOU15140.1 hypothetical protein I588_04072 [Enterococcus pallens ATCC BAA-351]OJG79130.1 hypothetical protein RV10_GL000963 [Enterococcus pallens]
MKNFWVTVKDRLTAGWQLFLQAVSENEKKSLTIAASLVIFSIVFSVSVGYAQKSIRKDELNTLVNQQIQSKHITPFAYEEGDAAIKESQAISVMFAQPHGDSLENVLTILDNPKQEEELNRTFYYYPLVYNSSKIAEVYNIDPTKVTFIFFQKGQEKNRFVVEDLKDLNKEFVPELNRLPMWRLKDQNENN